MADRAEYIAGLRLLAVLLEQHPDLPLPYYGASETYGRMTVFCSSREQIAEFARLLPGQSTKHVDQDNSNYGFALHGTLAGLHLDIRAHRDEVCERVVTGTETVVKQVPDPTVDVPLVEVTEDVEIVEWRCAPLLSDAPSGGA